MWLILHAEVHIVLVLLHQAICIHLVKEGRFINWKWHPMYELLTTPKFNWNHTHRYGRLGHGDSEDQLKPKLVEALIGYRVIDVACGSGDAQTLCITDDDSVWSFGDGDYGKLGRGGSEGCKYPIKIDSLVGLGVIKVECGSQVLDTTYLSSPIAI